MKVKYPPRYIWWCRDRTRANANGTMRSTSGEAKTLRAARKTINELLECYPYEAWEIRRISEQVIESSK